MSGRVLISGGSGLIGKRLISLLQSNGYSVSNLSRRPSKMDGVETLFWDPIKGELDQASVENFDACIHLAGAGVADKRWTSSYKKMILDSRVKSTNLLLSTFSSMAPELRPKSFIGASAVGIYGYSTGEKYLEETDDYGSDFMAEVTKSWEEETIKLEELISKVIRLRIGFVMSSDGGALEKLKQPASLGAGAAIGNGKQYISWIHEDDLIRMFLYAIENIPDSGVYNAVGPKPATNKEMMKTIAKVLGRPFFLPNVPGFILKLAMGEMANLALGGNRVSSKKIEEAGFQFKYNELTPTLESLLL